MTRNLLLDIFREVKHSFSRFASILLIVAIGVSFFAGLRSASPDMAYTMDDYFDQHNVMDFQVASTLGLTDADIDAIRSVDGVKQVQPGYFADALTVLQNTELVVRLHSLPEDYQTTNYINRLTLVEGALPQNANEVVVERSRNVDYGIRLGDTLELYSAGDTPIDEGTLKSDHFTVVGFVTTPYYLTFDKGISQVGGRNIGLFAYTMEDAFDYPDVYVEALITVEGAAELNTFSSAYTRRLDEVRNTLSNVGADRSILRGNELRGDAEKMLADGQKQYDEALEKFQTEIADAEKQLEDAYTQLITGEAQLEAGKETYEKEIAAGEEEIREGEKTLAASAAQLRTLREQLKLAQTQLDLVKVQFTETVAASEIYLQRLQDLENLMGRMSTLLAVYNDALSRIDDPEMRQQLQGMINVVNNTYNTMNAEYQSISRLNRELNNSIVTIQGVMNNAQHTLDDANAQVNDAQREYDAGVEKLAAGRAQLAEAKEEGQKKLDDAAKELEDGWKEYNEGKEEFETQRAEGQRQLDEASTQLLEGKFQIERIDNAVWYILDRNTNYGYVSYDSTVDRMAALGSVIPVFFILIAVLVCMTTMTRMVGEQRGVIGTYKALGYGNNAIAAKYVLYVLAASLVGAVIGLVLGILLFPRAVYGAWSVMYTQPPLKQQIHWGEVVISLSVTILAMVATAYLTCRAELESVPSQLMRPKAPKIGKPILLERIEPLWKRLNFSQKVTMRNIFRYKKRLAMTLIGIIGCTSLLVAGFGMNDTIGSVVPNQYGEIYRSDFEVATTGEAAAEELMAMVDSRQELSATRVGAVSITVSTEKGSETLSMTVTADPESLPNFITLRNRVSGKPIALDDTGIVLTEKLAETLGVGVGDYVNVVDSTNITKTIPVSGVTEHYVFHYAYMSQTAYHEHFHQDAPQSSMLITHSGTTQEKDSFYDELNDMDIVSSVLYYSDMAVAFNDQIGAMKSITYLIIVCAMLLAFVVLYNLTNINVSERIREIATIKVLGFRRKEVAMYIYRENFLMTLMGAFLGLFVGVGLHRMIIKAIEQTNVMFGFQINGLSFVWSVLLTCVFSVLVMLYMYPKLVNIQMVESLKSVE